MRRHAVVTCLAVLAILAAGSAGAATWQWDGGAGSGDWTAAGNWSPDGTNAETNGTFASRLNVNSAQELVYSAAQGTTVFTGDGTGRGLVIGSGALGSGTLRITGGVFSTFGGTAGDVVGNNANTATLTIEGGTYIGTASGTGLGIGGGPTAILNVSAGTGRVASLTLNATLAAVNLSGTGVLEVNSISRGGGTANLTLNGGTLRARVDSASFLQGLTAATVNDGGVTIDSNGRSITIGQSLLAGTGSGGLTKTGGGNLTLAGANTYVGLTTVNNGQMLLNTTGGGALAGDVTLSSTSAQRTYLRLMQSDQMAATATLNMELKGTGTVYSEIALQGNSQTLAALNPTWDGTVGGGNIYIENRVFNDAGGGNGVLTIDGATDSTWGSRVLVRDGHSGTLSLVKEGAGTLTLGSANTYVGTTTVNGGTLKLGVSATTTTAGPLGHSSGSTTIQGGGTLDFNGYKVHAERLVISGDGVGGQGALVNSGGDQINAVQDLVLGGDATLGGSGRWDLRQNTVAPTLDMAGHTLTKTGANYIGLIGATISNPGDVIVNGGELNLTFGSTFGGAGAVNSVTVNSGGTLGLYQTGTDHGSTLNLNDGSTLRGQSSGASTQNTWAGPVNVAGAVTVKADAVLTISGDIGGTGSIDKTGASTLTLSGANSYGGGTTVRAGTLALSGGGTVGSGDLTIAAGATFDVSGATGGSYTLGTGRTLRGNGTVTGGLIMGAGSTLSPGNSTGTNLFAGALTLTSNTNAFELVSPADYDQIVVGAAGSLTLTGSPILALNLAGYSSVPGDAFRIFDNQFGGAVSGTLWLDGSTELTDGATFAAAGLQPGHEFQIDYDGGTGNDITLTVVPEPASLGLLGAASLAALLRRRARR